ncbi:hypothetical protein PSI19_20420 [Xenorhabdus khoisanae]|uniref:hypothetical protein n=1 Tax=Xenorhabdus khoisanae TaxID=880157 RepID=UPI0023598445|nr:hypothetical protein [Xenorhabdus khoisanae]MDC9616173.1 hypothetical protein [Xenorhabdus khoisanae]
MLDFIFSLQVAFDKSINHMTWAIFSLVACFSLVVTFAEKKDTKLRQLFVRALFYPAIAVFLIIGALNILYAVLIINKYVSGLAGIAIGVCTVIAAVNAGIITWGIIKKENKSKDL